MSSGYGFQGFRLTAKEWERLNFFWGDLTTEYSSKQLDLEDEKTFWSVFNKERAHAFEMYASLKLGLRTNK